MSGQTLKRDWCIECVLSYSKYIILHRCFFGRNNINYGAEEIDPLKEEVDDKEEDPEDDPDVQDIRWF